MMTEEKKQARPYEDVGPEEEKGKNIRDLRLRPRTDEEKHRFNMQQQGAE
jgi:hypothetical protein